jgi:hypothetical protein
MRFRDPTLRPKRLPTNAKLFDQVEHGTAMVGLHLLHPNRGLTGPERLS